MNRIVELYCTEAYMELGSRQRATALMGGVQVNIHNKILRLHVTVLVVVDLRLNGRSHEIKFVSTLEGNVSN